MSGARVHDAARCSTLVVALLEPHSSLRRVRAVLTLLPRLQGLPLANTP